MWCAAFPAGANSSTVLKEKAEKSEVVKMQSGKQQIDKCQRLNSKRDDTEAGKASVEWN